MRKLFVLSLAVFLLLNSVGYTIYAHYCDDILKDASLIVNTSDSCCEDDPHDVPTNAAVEMTCCNDQNVLVIIQDSFVKSELDLSALDVPLASLLFTIPSFLTLSNNSISHPVQQIYKGSPPDLPIPNLLILQQVFRI